MIAGGGEGGGDRGRRQQEPQQHGRKKKMEVGGRERAYACQNVILISVFLWQEVWTFHGEGLMAGKFPEKVREKETRSFSVSGNFGERNFPRSRYEND